MGQAVMRRDLDKLSARLCNIARRFPEMQREMHEKLGDALLRTVRGQIAGSLRDSRGRIAGYQAKYIGARGGYAAVRAANRGTGANSPGAITNYLENGHKIRRPSGRSKYKYRPRIHRAYVDGFHWARRSVA